MPVDTTHPAYDLAREGWKRNRDAVAGQDAIRAEGELYLPRPNAEDTSLANRARYDRYLARALWYAAPERTKASLIGSVFRKDPEAKEIPAQIEYLDENADGAGTSLEQVAKAIIGEQLEVGRVGLLVDYPDSEPGASEEEVRLRNLRANFSVYAAESVINWRTETMGGATVLTLVVLAEQIEEVHEDGFGSEVKDRYRVLRLDDGVYVQEVYDDAKELVSQTIPRNSAGASWNRIPFVVIGSETNRPDVDQAPLTHLCNHAIAYWQTSADHRENLYTHGQLTLGISSDLSVDEWKEANPNGVTVGAPSGVFLGTNGSFHTASAPESSSLSNALVDLREEMRELGAQIIQKQSQGATATATRKEASAEESVLSNVVGNASEGIEAALEWACEFMGGNAEAVEFRLNREFSEETLDPQTRTVMLNELDRGIIAKTDYRASLRKVDAISRTDEEIDDEAEAEGPALGLVTADDGE